LKIVFVKSAVEALFHSVQVTSNYLAKEFEKQGHEIIFWDRSGSIPLIDIKADAVFLREIDKVILMINRYGYVKWQPKVFAFLDRGETDAINVGLADKIIDVAGFTHPLATKLWQARTKGTSFTCGYGFAEDLPLGDNPYNEEKNIVYLGAMYHWKYYEQLRAVAEHFKDATLHIIGGTLRVKKYNLILHEKPEPDIAKGLFPSGNVILHGGMQYGTFNNYLYYADVGLSYSHTTLNVLHCKVWDYLSNGLPTIVTPADSPEGELVKRTGCGYCVNHGDYIKAIDKALNTRFDRQGSIDYMIANEGFKSVAKRWEKYLC